MAPTAGFVERWGSLAVAAFARLLPGGNVSTNETVLIVGAGPVGLCLALDLAQRGVCVVVFEAREALSSDPRGTALHPPTLELLEAWDIFEPIRNAGRVVDRLQYWDWVTRELVAEFPFELLVDDTAFPFRLHVPQYAICQILLDRLEYFPHVRVLSGHRVVDIVDHATSVELTVEHTRGLEVFRGRFVCAADGNQSAVRQRMGVGFSGIAYDERYLITELDLDLMITFADTSPQSNVGLAPAAYLLHPKQWAVISLMADHARIMFCLRPEESASLALRQDNLRVRMSELFHRHVDFEFQHRGVFRAHEGVAETFYLGNVLLAGDAAHGANPAGSTTMNMGLHDAAVLGPAITWALDHGPEGLVDYDRQRRRHATTLVQATAQTVHHILSAQSFSVRQRRNADLRYASRDPARARDHLRVLSLLSTGAWGDTSTT